MCGPMLTVIAAQPNVSGSLCWMLLIKSWNWTKTRNPLGCLKLANRCQTLGHVEEILLFNKFFSIVDTCLSCEDITRQIRAMSMSVSVSVVDLYSA